MQSCLTSSQAIADEIVDYVVDVMYYFIDFFIYYMSSIFDVTKFGSVLDISRLMFDVR